MKTGSKNQVKEIFFVPWPIFAARMCLFFLNLCIFRFYSLQAVDFLKVL